MKDTAEEEYMSRNSDVEQITTEKEDVSSTDNVEEIRIEDEKNTRVRTTEMDIKIMNEDDDDVQMIQVASNSSFSPYASTVKPVSKKLNK